MSVIDLFKRGKPDRFRWGPSLYRDGPRTYQLAYLDEDIPIVTLSRALARAGLAITHDQTLGLVIHPQGKPPQDAA